MRETFHLVTTRAWEAADGSQPYWAASLETEGFVHCTDGLEALGETFDRYFAADPRPYLALTLDLDALGAPWRQDPPGSPYPHVYGPLDRGAIVGIRRVQRHEDGRFAGLEPH